MSLNPPPDSPEASKKSLRLSFLAAFNSLIAFRALYSIATQVLSRSGNLRESGQELMRMFLAYNVLVALLLIGGSWGLIKRRAWGITLTAGAGAAWVIMTSAAAIYSILTVSEWATSHTSGGMAFALLINVALLFYWLYCLISILGPSHREECGIADSQRFLNRTWRLMLMMGIPAIMILFLLHSPWLKR
jgi:hypothetical protein